MLSFETVQVVIERPYSVVYGFLADPRNLTQWIDVLGPVHHPAGPMEWVFDRPAFNQGPITVRFTPHNAHGVLDIRAFFEGRLIYWAPARAIDLGEATAVTLGLVSNLAEDQRDAHNVSEREWVEADLLTLKTLLEAG